MAPPLRLRLFGLTGAKPIEDIRRSRNLLLEQVAVMGENRGYASPYGTAALDFTAALIGHCAISTMKRGSKAIWL